MDGLGRGMRERGASRDGWMGEKGEGERKGQCWMDGRVE